MKQKLAAVAFLVLSGCIDSARFEVPQPEGVQDEKSVPKKLFGKYLSTSDSTILTITKNLIFKTTVANFKEALSKLDSAERAKLDSANSTHVHSDGINPKIEFQIRGDTVFYHVTTFDTLFFQSDKFSLRKFKGYYFLSKEISFHSWQVRKLEKIKGGIIIGEIATKQELNELRSITEVVDSTTTFKPTKQQFKKILQQDGFKSKEKFLRIE